MTPIRDVHGRNKVIERGVHHAFLLGGVLAGATLFLAQSIPAAEPVPAVTGNSPHPLVLSSDSQTYPLGLSLQILEDRSGRLSIDDVASPDREAEFRPSHRMYPNFGISRSAW